MGASARMTWSEIRELYPDRWVVLVEQELHADDNSQLHTARVLASGASRAEAVQRAYPAVRVYASYGCRYTGARRAAPEPRSVHGPRQAIYRPSPAAPPTTRADRESTGERLTWKQICKRYPQQWVILIDPEWQPHDATELAAARVVAVAGTRAEVKARAHPLLDCFPDSAWSCHYTGPSRELAGRRSGLGGGDGPGDGLE